MSTERVRAAVMAAPGKIGVQEFPRPSLEEGALLVKMEMSGICGTDKHTYRGEGIQYGGTKAETRTPFPIIPGHENVGIVAEITNRACKDIEFSGKPLKEGDRVVICPDIVCGKCYYCRYIAGYLWCDNPKGYGNMSCADPPHLLGGWSEYLYVMPASYVYKVPEDIPPRIAVLAELMAVTYNLDKAKEFFSMSGEPFGFCDTVVVQGVGPLGLCHLIKARMLGAGDIIAIDKSEFRLNMAKEFGADYIINIKDTTSEDRIDYVRDLTEGRGADVVIECAGVPQVIPEGLEMLRRGGMYIETGNFVDMGEVSINPHRHLCAKNVRLIGLTNHPNTGYVPTLKAFRKYGHIFPFEKIVTHFYTIDEADKALEKSMEMDSMKVVITP